MDEIPNNGFYGFYELHTEIRTLYRELHDEYMNLFPHVYYTIEELEILRANIVYENTDFKMMYDELLKRIPEDNGIDIRLLQSQYMGISDLLIMCMKIVFRISNPILLDTITDSSEKDKGVLSINEIVLLSQYVIYHTNNRSSKEYLYYVSLMHSFIQYITTNSVYMENAFSVVTA